MHLYTNFCDKWQELYVSENNKDVQVYFRCFLPRQYLHIACLIHLLIYWECLCFCKSLLLTTPMCCFQDKFLSMNSPKSFAACSLLICTFSVRRLGKVCGSNCLFGTGWSNNHLALLTFRDNFSGLNYVMTFSSSTFILTKSVSMLWDRNKFVPSAKVTSIKAFDALNRSFTKIRKISGRSLDPCGTPQIISRQFSNTSWEDMHYLLLLS